ncbi:hypothetical protein LCGC14_0253990 [marine sediment metagenome]|uniref:glutamyl-tRNA reductase n=1 Tax=marine sediment metagenome TaxID=412755 RepID=A0A0F9X8E8_9ZZZZ|nr:glutamyl-tRNA reductase [Phycisphaerae bacterium]HDZ44690.1 glutamyl-tRNA reductase [Phycisphaerae bacterium]
MNITAIGISHHTAPVGVREAFALPGDLPLRLLRAFKAEDAFEEALVLDTCNRTEVYFVANKCDDPMGYLLGHIARLKSIPAVTDTSAFYHHQGADAVQHMFRVAGALDSQIVGEHQILGQLKGAYRLALEARTTGLLLNKLLHWAFRVGKRAQSETNLGRGSTSIAQAAVELAQQVFASLAGKSVMLVGAGETGALAAKALVRVGAGNVVVANRSLDRARKVAESLRTLQPEDAVALDLEDPSIRCPALLAMLEMLPKDIDRRPAAGEKERFAARAIELPDIPQAIGDVDLVICATGAPDMVLTGKEITKALRRAGRSVLIVDIAVPRDVDPKLDKLSNVFLYNIDDLDRIVSKNIATRELEVPRVEAIIADEFGTFAAWCDSLEVIPTIKILQEYFAEIQQAEIKRYGGKFSDADREQLEQFTRSLCNKILHQPIAFLRSLSDSASLSQRQAAADFIRSAFRLKGRKDKP